MKLIVEQPYPITGSVSARALAQAMGLPSRVQRWAVNLARLGRPWTLGLITGPSGCGKTTLARAVFPEARWLDPTPHAAESLFDLTGGLTEAERVASLMRCGLGSPRQWFCPPDRLSGGQRILASLLPMFIEGRGLWIADEFGSTMDRRRAKLLAMTMRQRLIATVRRRADGAQINRTPRLVVISAWSALARWLAPDWIMDGRDGTIRRRTPPKPDEADDRFSSGKLTLERTSRRCWSNFAWAHFLDETLHRSARAYLVRWHRVPVGFVATLQVPGKRGFRRVTRLVIDPVCQGLGLGINVLNMLAEVETVGGDRLSIVTRHPGLAGALSRSPMWRFIRRCRRRPHQGLLTERRMSEAVVSSFAYLPNARAPDRGGHRETLIPGG
ncbi:MAG: hypothetical protein JJU36_04285 [Phycisphaeraceae bacterium]|nr:hypothetical protein [Phycisphaeraceae bacterium]